MSLTRRAVCSLIPALVSAGALFPTFAEQDDSLPSGIFAFETMSEQESEHVQMRRILKGKVTTGQHIEAREPTLPPNAFPHPPRHHVHSEVWLICEGIIALTINGATHRLGPGELGFVRSNEEHGIKNAGLGPATYFFIAIGTGEDA